MVQEQTIGRHQRTASFYFAVQKESMFLLLLPVIFQIQTTSAHLRPISSIQRPAGPASQHAASTHISLRQSESTCGQDSTSHRLRSMFTVSIKSHSRKLYLAFISPPASSYLDAQGQGEGEAAYSAQTSQEWVEPSQEGGRSWLTMASREPKACSIFWWWLRHWTGERVAMCLLIMRLRWYFLFCRTSPFTRSMQRVRKSAYRWFSSAYQCRALNLRFLGASSRPQRLLRGLKNQGLISAWTAGSGQEESSGAGRLEVAWRGAERWDMFCSVGSRVDKQQQLSRQHDSINDIIQSRYIAQQQMQMQGVGKKGGELAPPAWGASGEGAGRVGLGEIGGARFLGGGWG